jgi:hypothetical protein
MNSSEGKNTVPEMPSAEKVLNSMQWLPAYVWQRMTRTQSRVGERHLILALADHFEPSFRPEAPTEFAPRDVQEQRLEKWCRVYPKVFDAWRDSAGFPFVHTYFYPAEQYDPTLLERLAEHCHAGWGEIEIQLHHGVNVPDKAENTRRQLVEFRDSLASLGCLSRAPGDQEPRYGFVHGNWALANSCGGRFCGVDEEMQLLAETGCFADFTLPSAPNAAQVAKINLLYECGLPLTSRAPHRRAKPLRSGLPPTTFPLIVEGPLQIDFGKREKGRLPVKIENAAVTGPNPPSLRRLQLWMRAAITVDGRPDWLFIKLHCHGMDPRDESSMIGEAAQRFMGELMGWVRENPFDRLHFVTGREMVNIALAAADGNESNPSDYRDYSFQPYRPRLQP